MARRLMPSRVAVLTAVSAAAALVASAAPRTAHAQSAGTDPGFGAWPVAQPDPAPRDEASSDPERKDEPRDFQLDAAATTVVPLMIGAQVTLELPVRLQLQGELGVLPGAYVDAADSILVSTGAYGDAESQIVRAALRDSMVMRLSAGWRPFEDHGFEMFGGYTMINLGTSVTARDAVEAYTAVTLPAGVGTESVDLDATIHAVHATIGWRWVVADHLTIRTSLGYVHALSASTHVTVPDSVSNVAGASNVDNATSLAEARLDDLMTTYGELPTVGLSVGYRF